MGLNIEQIGKAVGTLEKRMAKRKSVEETMRADLQMVLNEYISQEMMESYFNGRFDSERKSIVSDVVREITDTLKTGGKQNNDTDCNNMRPCPFCGCDEVGITCEESPRIYCKECGTLAPKGNAQVHAIKIWNNRYGENKQ